MIIRSVVRVILFLCLFVQSSSTNYLRCTSKCSQITVSFLQPLEIPDECQYNTAADIYDYGLICIIDYRIDYDAKYIYINFKASNDINILQEYNQSEFLLQTVWLGFNEEAGQPNITHRKYGCTTQNDCARQFYYETIEYLIENGQYQLDKIKSKLYRKTLSISRNASRRCRNSNTTSDRSLIGCRDGLCYINNVNEIAYCAYDDTPTFFSEFEYYLPRSITNEIELIEYKCNRHLCNSNKMVDAIKDILRNYTNWKSIKENSINEESQTQEDYPVKDGYQTKEDYPTKDSHQTKEDHPTKDSFPTNEDYPTKDRYPAKEDYPTKDSHQAKEDHPTKDGYPTKEDYPTKENYPTKDRYQTEEEFPAKDGYADQTKENYQVTEQYQVKKVNETKEDNKIIVKSSTIRQDVSYILIVLTLMNRRFLF